jgi:hypothetical protein
MAENKIKDALQKNMVSPCSGTDITMGSLWASWTWIPP